MPTCSIRNCGHRGHRRPDYIAGEETAAVRAINGGPAKPTDKPPRPFEEGVGGLPTLVSNVETLANLPFVARHGARRLPAEGTSASPGPSSLPSPAPDGPPHSTSFRTARRSPISCVHGVSADQVHGVLMGGYFAGLLNRTSRRHARPRDDAQTRQRPGMRRGRDPHRRLPGRGRSVGDGLLRPGERRPVRIVLQRHRRDVGGHRGPARRGGHRGGRGAPRAMVGGAARPGRVCAPWTPPPTSPRACCGSSHRSSRAISPVECDACRADALSACGPTKWRR